jgi:hypothetical protein
MGYTIEISFNIIKKTNVIEINYDMISLAKKYGCENYYYVDLENKSHRKLYVIAFYFEQDDISNLIEFIKNVKKTKSNKIDCIYDDNILCKMIYASGYYLRKIDKSLAKKYKTLRNSEYKGNDLLIFNEMITC